MIINVDKESHEFIKVLMTQAQKSPNIDYTIAIPMAIFQQSIKLIEEPKVEESENE